ncbi:SgcJ/EcaC family oxidoreductase [Pendulispora rubella]|uniref:SgcJ/EcaC family oxidoreductase n=1 Tax=Pendulispora rubella TaxID=2741070 RepID=A0ABZ2L741_9BACT
MAAILAAGCGGSPGAPAAGAQAPMVSKQTIAALFDQWNAALATGDPAKVADLYAPHAVLLPTVSNEIRVDRDDIIDYFVKFLKSKPQGKIDREIVDVVDENTAINTGVYTFTLTQDGKQQQVTARYTYVYELMGGKWLIVNHHSSVMPPK